ncbi:OmpA family protein [Neobacillus sp. LXY-4]|uniref:OmpA family protein n=1 Tax=Neobacillus sp. LXY-4 TaxID=3379826 RepID=UPI003EE0C409
MKKRKQHDHEEHIDESWLIPYADLLTLLLALFIVLFASSNLSMEKYQQIMISMNNALSGQGNSSIKQEVIIPKKGNDEKEDKQEENSEEAKKLQGLYLEIDKYIKERGLENVITLKDEPKGIKLSLKDVILFESGSAELKGDSLTILAGLLDLIKQVQNPISIEGHTDNVPITGAQFQSNWELSAARALSVLYFFEQQGIPSSKLQFAGFGEQKPVFSNDTSAHRAANRRVDIIILKTE